MFRKLTKIPFGSIIGLIGTVWSIYVSMPLFTVTRGMVIRPMVLTAVAMASALFTIMLGLTLTQLVDRQINTTWQRWGIVLSAFPLLYVMFGWSIIAFARGFVFAQ